MDEVRDIFFLVNKKWVEGVTIRLELEFLLSFKNSNFGVCHTLTWTNFPCGPNLAT